LGSSLKLGTLIADEIPDRKPPTVTDRQTSEQLRKKGGGAWEGNKDVLGILIADEIPHSIEKTIHYL
jgi:hypothetical protein